MGTDPTENDEERKLTVQWPLWSEPKLIVLGTDLWLTSSSLLFWAFETSAKFSVLTPVPLVLYVHDAFSEAALQQIPIKSEVVFLNSHFSAASHCCNVPLRQEQTEKLAATLSVSAKQEYYPGRMLCFFPTGTRDRKAMWSVWDFWCICPLAEAGGRAECIKSHTTFLLFMA